MSLLSWFAPKKKHDHELSALPSSGLSRLESTKPMQGQARAGHGHGQGHGSARPANRKQERLERRELLYAVVRECMTRAGVLSSSYKFKVLSLDPRGHQFLVMVDLAYAGGADTNRLAEIEAMVAQSAKQRYDIMVTAVYWRANEHVAVGDLVQSGRPPISRPAPLHAEARHSVAAPLAEHIPRPAAPTGKRFEPVEKDEVAAFQRALDAGTRGEQALASANNGNPAPAQSHALLTGFEDTEMADSNPELGKTQYGSLR